MLLNAVAFSWLGFETARTTTTRGASRSWPAPPVATAQPTPSREERNVRQLNWRQIESTNYSEYIANLRSIGCPEPTIRDIVAADVAATLRGLAASGLSAGSVVEVQEDTERLVVELMGVPVDRQSVSALSGPLVVLNRAEADRYRPAWPGRGEPSEARAAAVTADSLPEAAARPEESVGDPTILDAEIARQRWIATYITTRYGQQAWNGFEQDSTAFGGDIEALMRNLNIPIPEAPQRLQPVSR